MPMEDNEYFSNADAPRPLKDTLLREVTPPAGFTFTQKCSNR